jgi:hypothetical protein
MQAAKAQAARSGVVSTLVKVYLFIAVAVAASTYHDLSGGAVGARVSVAAGVGLVWPVLLTE